MNFTDVIHRTWERNTLFTVLIELTYRCNLNCFFCYNDLALEGRPLDREQYYDFFADLHEMGVWNVVLSGGEPLAHPDFFDLGKRLRELGFVVRIKSNGHALRGVLAERLRREVDPFIVEVSLHGATAATHDRQTQVPGSFERLLSNLREMLDLGLRVKLNSTLTAWNWRELPLMLRLAESLGVQLQVDPEVTPRDDGDQDPLTVSPPDEALQLLFRLQAEARETSATAPALAVVREGDDLFSSPAAGSRKYCGAGSSGIAVDPYGNIYPCVQWRRSIGTLHDTSIRELWADSRELAEIRRQTVEAKETVMAAGPEGLVAAFCPGQAALRTGDATEPYGEFQRRTELHRKVAAEGRPTRLPIFT